MHVLIHIDYQTNIGRTRRQMGMALDLINESYRPRRDKRRYIRPRQNLSTIQNIFIFTGKIRAMAPRVAKPPPQNLTKYILPTLVRRTFGNPRQKANIMSGPHETGFQLTPQPSSWKDSLSYNPRVGRLVEASPLPSARPAGDESCVVSGNRVSPSVPSSRGGDALGGEYPSPPIEERKDWSAADICKNESARVKLAAYD